MLRGISFHIPAGQAVAVVGATGAGKTSLISLLARFYDIQRGSITLDGVDIRQLRQGELRRHVAAVPQDPVCFSGTIASNIRLHDETIDDEQLRRAAEIANAAPFIERLPGGYDYAVRERGSNLSVGQRQLLAFARAIAFNPEVLLILDEATSSVDTETEALIQEALARLLKGRTSIVIAHRLSTIRHVDRIIVLHKGRVVEDGHTRSCWRSAATTTGSTSFSSPSTSAHRSQTRRQETRQKTKSLLSPCLLSLESCLSPLRASGSPSPPRGSPWPGRGRAAGHLRAARQARSASGHRTYQSA